MKTKIVMAWLLWVSVAVPGRASVQLIQFGENNIAAIVPDNNLSGLARSFTVTGQDNFIPHQVTVRLKIQGTGQGAFNGDYYADLRHLSADGSVTTRVTLLNRPGRSSTMTSGYSDNGLDVLFEDSASDDIHSYRLSTTGGDNNALGGPLTGSWQPDGRDVDLLTALNTSPRTSSLMHLASGSPNGTWTLFVVDASAGGTGQVTDWEVKISGVPEPSSASLLILGLAAVLARRRRCRRSAV